MNEQNTFNVSGFRHDLGGVLAALRTARELSEYPSDATELLDLSIQRIEKMIGDLKKEMAK